MVTSQGFIQRFFLLSLLFLWGVAPAFGGNRIKIGVSLPLTGGAAIEGVDVHALLLFANKHFADDVYELIFEDDKCSEKDAVSVAQKFADVDKVSYVLGFVCSGTAGISSHLRKS